MVTRLIFPTKLIKMATYCAILSLLAKSRFAGNETKAEAALKQWTLEVMYHESKFENVRQIGGGPGRGYFQYELAEKGSGANKTAINRAILWLDKNYSGKAPKWLKDLAGKDVDFTTLTLDQQALIFLLDKNADAGTTFKNLVDSHGSKDWNKVSEENWRKGHYKGPASHTWRGADYAKASNIPNL